MAIRRLPENVVSLSMAIATVTHPARLSDEPARPRMSDGLADPSLDVTPGGLRFVEPRLQPPVRFEEQLIFAKVSLVPFRVRLHGGYLIGESLRDVEAVEDADPADDGRCSS